LSNLASNKDCALQKFHPCLIAKTNITLYNERPIAIYKEKHDDLVAVASEDNTYNQSTTQTLNSV